MLVGHGVHYYKHAISKPANGRRRICLVVRYVRKELLKELEDVAACT